MEAHMKQSRCLFNVTPVRLSGSLVVLLSLLMSLTPALPVKAGGLSFPTNDETSKNAAKEVVRKLFAEDFEGVRANFNEQMKQGLSADKMREVWTAAMQYHGKYQGQAEPVVRQVQGYDVVVIRCEMERSPMEVEVDYDQNGKVGGLWVRPARS
jgi:hypothetical protein